jgi:hypothetical protein
MYLHLMISRNIFIAILYGFLLASCSQNNTSTNSVVIRQKPNPTKLFLTVLDCNNDTIDSENSFQMDSLFSSPEFQNEGHYVISYEKFEELSKHFTNLDMAQISIVNGIEQKGELAILKKEFNEPKYQNFKINHVKNINWLEVNATQIGPAISTWGISGQEGIEECEHAIKKNYSYAEMHARWQLKYPNAIPFNQYMKSAKDSLFVKGSNEDTYIFTFGDSETDAFHFHDLGITADLNGDGIADRAATWHYNVSAGICGITKKSPKGLIEFFPVDME